MTRSKASTPLHTSYLAQPQVYGPLNIKAEVRSYEHDPRITIVTFRNEGNTGAPRRLKPAALVPIGVEAHILRLMPQIKLYPMHIDSVIERIFITLGILKVGTQEVDVLAAIIDLRSLQEETYRISHCCSAFD